MTKQTLAMSFQSQTVTTFVKLNLTDLGRRKMALGTFSVSRAIFSDREVRYAFNRRYPVKDPVFTNMNPTSDRLYDIENNKVLAPAFAAPGLPPRNYDGSQPYQIGERIVASTQVLTARTESRGLWSAVTEGSNQAIGQYIVDQSKTIATAVTASNLFLGTNQVFSIGTAHTGNFAFIRQRTPTTLQPDTESDAPIMGLWYRIVDGTNSIKLDRDVGIFNSGTVPIPVYCYPASATTDYWNSGTTAPGEVWSLNIVRTSNMIGSDAQNLTGYTSYGSKEFAGTKRYFGFDRDQRAVGFVWHEDKFTGNTYGDLFIPRTTRLDLPDLMWHRKSGELPGEAVKTGHRFVDAGSEIIYDEVAKSNYTLLRDGTDMNAITIGRVYYDLKLIVITDQEILTTMTYKSNRNYTLPKLNVELTESHPLGNNAPWIQDGYTYYFTYYMRNALSYSTEDSYGFEQTSPCEYWTEVVGRNKTDGSAYYASASFDPSGFPYMRDETNMESLSGTGWMANQIQLLVNALPTSETGATGADRVRSTTWTAVTNGELGSTTNIEGVYRGEATHDNIYPQYLGTRVFNISQTAVTDSSVSDYNGSSPYYRMNSSQTTFWSFTGETGVTFGDEIFLNGNVTTTFGVKTEKLVATVSVNKDELNDSRNGGFDGKIDTSTYITEIGLFNDRGELMAVGKPTYPIRKNNARHLLFQLEIDI